MQGGRVIAAGSPDAHIEVQGVASGRVGGGNVKTCFDGFVSAVGEVPLWNVLLSGDTLVGARAP